MHCERREAAQGAWSCQKTLYKVKGDVPANLVMRLNDGAGAHIRTHAYKYDKLIRCAHQLETRCAHQLETS